MNRKEAEKIENDQTHFLRPRAIGFLEGSDYEIKRTEVLIESLKKIIRYSDDPFRGCKWDKERREIAKEALAEYRKGE
jgi:hypothetical protein